VRLCDACRLGARAFVAACASVAAGCLVGTYRLVNDFAPSREVAPHRGWQWITVGSGTAAGLEGLALVLGAGCVVLVALWAHLRQVSSGWVLLAAGWALAGALTGVAVQIVSAPAWTSSYGRIAIVAVVAGWLLVVGVSYAVLHPRPSTMERQPRGCAYCAVDAHLLAGDVQQVAVRDDRETVLLRCPHCRWLYEVAITGTPGQARRVSEAQALDDYAGL
jgi:hypothetical protein